MSKHLRHVPLDDLAPFAGNPKDHDVPGIRASFTNYGWRGAIIARDTADGFTIVAGHGRIEALRAMREAGDPAPDGISKRWTVPVIVETFDSDDAAAGYLLADNALTEAGGWNIDAVEAFLDTMAPGAVEVLGAAIDLADIAPQYARGQAVDPYDWASATEALGGGGDFQTITFTVHRSDFATVENALGAVDGEYAGGETTNTNGQRLVALAQRVLG